MGFTASYTGTALVTMKNMSDLVLDNSDISWVVSIMSVGGCFGSAIGGPLIDYFGRRGTILAIGFPFVAAYLLIASADRVSMIVVGRFMAGLCVGINSTAIPVFLGEILDAKIRGTLGIFPTAMGNLGILVALFAGSYLNWRELAFLGALLPVPYIFLILSISESPRYYASRNRMDDAFRALQWYRGASADVTTEFREMLELSGPQEMNPEQGIFREFIKPGNFKPVMIILILMTIQQFSGVNAIIAFIVPIFELAPIPLDPNRCAILFGVINFVAVFLAIPVIDKYGRKVLLYISDLCMSKRGMSFLCILLFLTLSPPVWTLLMFGIYFYLEEHKYAIVDYIHWLPVFSAVFYILGFSFGFGPVPWLMMGELLPLSIRGFAAGMLSSYNWLCASIIQMLFLIMIETLDESGTFWLFAGFCVAGFYTIVLVPETKGKSLEIIEAELLNDTEHDGFLETFNL